MSPPPPATDPTRTREASRKTEPSAPQPGLEDRSGKAGSLGKERGGGQAQKRRAPSQTSRQTLAEPMLMLDVEAAMKEIIKVPAATIHRTAAFAWASRAIAGYRVCASKAAVQEGLSYLYLGEHYREAALAHAAMGEAWQPLFTEIDEAMAEDRARAFGSMRGRSPVATR